MTRRCGVLGSPIAHSLSPVLHRAAYDALGLDWEYDAHLVDEGGLAGFLAGLGPRWRGLSLTRPLKEVAVGLCSRVEDRARLVGAVNTVLVEEPGRLVGSNTDIPGFFDAWRGIGLGVGLGVVGHAVVVGAGATARSAVAALAEVGVDQVSVLVRSPARASGLAALLGVLAVDGEVFALADASHLPSADLVVSTVPGVSDGSLDALAEQLVARAGAVCDVTYSPRLTPFVAAARRLGTPCTEGFDLLLHQATHQVELMTGCSVAPREAMREAGLAELSRREAGA